MFIRTEHLRRSVCVRTCAGSDRCNRPISASVACAYEDLARSTLRLDTTHSFDQLLELQDIDDRDIERMLSNECDRRSTPRVESCSSLGMAPREPHRDVMHRQLARHVVAEHERVADADHRYELAAVSEALWHTWHIINRVIRVAHSRALALACASYSNSKLGVLGSRSLEPHLGAMSIRELLDSLLDILSSPHNREGTHA